MPCRQCRQETVHTATRMDGGTCYHFLLRNDGVKESEEVGMIGDFVNVAPETGVAPSESLPPESLDRTNILDVWDNAEQPAGLAAYDFGFGTAFFRL